MRRTASKADSKADSKVDNRDGRWESPSYGIPSFGLEEMSEGENDSGVAFIFYQTGACGAEGGREFHGLYWSET